LGSIPMRVVAPGSEWLRSDVVMDVEDLIDGFDS